MKKLMTYTVFFLVFGNLCHAQSSAGKTAQKLIDLLVGTWKLDTMYKDGKGVARQSNSPENIEFTREAKYIIHSSSSQTADSGFYRTNEGNKFVYLQSSVHSQKPEQWNVEIKKDGILILSKKPVGHEKLFQYIYRRQNDKNGLKR